MNIPAPWSISAWVSFIGVTVQVRLRLDLRFVFKSLRTGPRRPRAETARQMKKMVPGAVPFEHQMKVCLPLDCYIYITSIQLYINNNINNNTIKHDTINNNNYYIFIFIYDAIIWLYNIIHICTWLYVHEDDNRWCNRPNPEKCLSLPVACYNWYWNQPPLEWMRYAQWILSPQTCAAQCTRCAR